MKNLKTILALCLAILFLSSSTKEKEVVFIPLEQLVSEEKLAVKIISLGGHSDKCIQFSLKNKTSDSLEVIIEAGRRLPSVDTSIQDILIVKSLLVQLEGQEEKTVKGTGYCCQSHNKSPNKDAVFEVGALASKELQQVAIEIDKSNYPRSVVQSAVWSISDGYALSSIHHENRDEIMPLLKTLGKIKGEITPWYSYTFETDTASLFTNKAEKIYGKINYTLKANSAVSVLIKDSRGKLLKTLVKSSDPGRGYHNFLLETSVKDWPKGEYYVYIYENYADLNSKHKFVIS